MTTIQCPVCHKRYKTPGVADVEKLPPHTRDAKPNYSPMYRGFIRETIRIYCVGSGAFGKVQP